MSMSIVSNEPECLVCLTTRNLHRHHVYGGVGRRSKSEKYGCWVYLCARHHNMSNDGVHFNKELDLRIKRMCQKRWEDKYGTREDFIKVFGSNYLD